MREIDRADEERIEECQLEVMELLEKLGATPEMIDFTMDHTVLASAKNVNSQRIPFTLEIC